MLVVQAGDFGNQAEFVIASHEAPLNCACRTSEQPVGHLVWPQPYPSSTVFTGQASLRCKGVGNAAFAVGAGCGSQWHRLWHVAHEWT
ncbi:MAG: hypothetical protein OHK0015_23420 [Chloroflexi bacterium OHK40]